MPAFRPSLRKFRVTYVFGFSTLFLLATGLLLPNALEHGLAKAQESVSPSRPPEGQAQQAPPQQPPPPLSNYDKTLFQKPIPSDQLAFLNQFSGVAAEDVIRDKQFRKLMKSFVPDCRFHYGRDMSLSDALDMVFKGSTLQVQVRDGRYMTMSGLNRTIPLRPGISLD